LIGGSFLVTRGWALIASWTFVDGDDGWIDDDCDNDPPDSNDGVAGDAPPCGMAVWRVSEPYINLWLHDIPLRYCHFAGEDHPPFRGLKSPTPEAWDS
jgi:hypothetical protein